MRLVAIVLFTAFVAQLLVAQQTPKAPTGTAEISGRVVNSASGTPVKNATVVLVLTNAEPGTPPSRRTTSEDGSFSFQKLAAGQYQLWTMRPGFGGFRGSQRGITRISLTDSQKVSDLLVKIAPAAVITGRIVDEDGQPMQQVQVQAMRWMMASGRAVLVGVGNATTNDLGEYRIFNLGAGRYYIKAQAMQVGFIGDDDDPPAKRYATEYFPDAKNVQNASAVVVAAGDEARADFQLNQEPVARIRGRVTGIPLGEGNVTQVILGGDATNGSAIVSNVGKFEINSVLPGTYRLVVFGFSTPQDRSDRRDAQNRTLAQQTIVVPETGLNNLEIHASPGGQGSLIAGQIRPEQPGGDMTRLIVGLQSADPNPDAQTMMFGQEYQQPQADGSFTLNAPASGNYYVAVNSRGPGFEDWYTKSIIFNGRDVTDDPLQLDDSSRGNLQVIVSSKGAVLEGTVTDSDDKPVTDVQVMTVPAGGKGRPELFQQTTTDQAGRFTIRGIAPGEYKIVALTDSDADSIADPSFTKTLASRGTSVRFDPGGRQTVALKVTTDTTQQ